jgi:hypothetical protein
MGMKRHCEECAAIIPEGTKYIHVWMQVTATDVDSRFEDNRKKMFDISGDYCGPLCLETSFNRELTGKGGLTFTQAQSKGA